jgi:hypothetical protein
VAAFFAALILNIEWPLPIVTPVLGLSLLVGIVTHTLRLQSRRTAAQPAAQPTT